MKKGYCKDCMFWVKQDVMGECHRNAPIYSENKVPHSQWPTTDSNDSCGECKYKYKEIG